MDPLHPNENVNFDRNVGIVLAVCSSVFIGASFIIKKKGLKLAGNQGLRAGTQTALQSFWHLLRDNSAPGMLIWVSKCLCAAETCFQRPVGAGGLGYLRQPIWWSGMLSMAVGELANFVAYAYAPAIIVTPLGALSVIVAAILAHYMLRERLNTFGALGCALCIVGSIVIVMHAPPDEPFTSIIQVRTAALVHTCLQQGSRRVNGHARHTAPQQAFNEFCARKTKYAGQRVPTYGLNFTAMIPVASSVNNNRFFFLSAVLWSSLHTS